MDICLRLLKESKKSRLDSYSVRNSVLMISHITFRNCRVHFFSDNLSRSSCIRIGTKLEGWTGQKVFYCLIEWSWIVIIVSINENMHGYIDMCDVLSYRCDHLVHPFLGKKWEIILETTWTDKNQDSFKVDSCLQSFSGLRRNARSEQETT